MRRTSRRILATAAVCGALLAATGAVRAQDYYYQPRSLYLYPPMYANVSVFGPQPIIAYEPVITFPAPVAGYYAPLAPRIVTRVSYPAPAPAPAAVVAPAPAPAAVVGPAPARIRERQVVTPFQQRFNYKVEYPGGLEYKYRYRQGFGRVRFTEKWDD